MRVAYLFALILTATPLHAAQIAVSGDAELKQLLGSGTLAPGDEVRLAAGTYGALWISKLRFDPAVRFAPADGAEVRLTGISIMDSSGIVVDGFTVRLGETKRDRIVEVRDSGNITLTHLDVASADDTDGWSVKDWRERVAIGINAIGQGITVSHNHVHVVRHGIGVRVDGALVEDNLIEDFTGDGMRALGDNSVYRGNRIRSCLKVDGNHDDGIQSWSRGADGKPGTGVIRNVLIEGNTIDNVTTHHPELNCKLQGIGFFDGTFENFTIRDNFIAVNQWHGITLQGARNVTITGNTVIDAKPGNPGPPWISIAPHKRGMMPESSLIADNVIERGGGKPGKYTKPYPGVTRRGDITYVPPVRGAPPVIPP